jgi:hypothetical protein
MADQQLLLQLDPTSMVLCTLSNGTNPFRTTDRIAKYANGMIAVREDLRRIRARVAYDIEEAVYVCWRRWIGGGGGGGEDS